MDTVQINFRMAHEMLAAIARVSGGKKASVYIREAVTLMLKIDGAKIDPAWVELEQGKRTDMATPAGRSRAEKQLAVARAALARKRKRKSSVR